MTLRSAGPRIIYLPALLASSPAPRERCGLYSCPYAGACRPAITRSMLPLCSAPSNALRVTSAPYKCALEVASTRVPRAFGH
jgi:hypothetical protein